MTEPVRYKPGTGMALEAIWAGRSALFDCSRTDATTVLVIARGRGYRARASRLTDGRRIVAIEPRSPDRA